jgi:membrane protein
MTKYSFYKVALLFRDAFRELRKNDPLRMAGATAFFTTFALPPILFILIQVLSLIFDPRTVRIQLFKRLTEIIGKTSTQQITLTLRSFKGLSQNWLINIAGFIFLLFVATTLFIIINGSLNQLWKIRVMVKRSIWFSLGNRMRSIFVILIAGVLFMIGLLIEAFQAFMGKYIDEIRPGMAIYFNGVLSHIISIVIVTAWFAFLFHFLPDGQPKWKVTLVGALITSLLFTAGKLILRWLLFHSNISKLYGASGSLVLLLLFVFYSSLILYYGAAFTKVWSEYRGQEIMPLRHAVHYKVAEVALKESN